MDVPNRERIAPAAAPTDGNDIWAMVAGWETAQIV